jgi:hypothetical protein
VAKKRNEVHIYRENFNILVKVAQVSDMVHGPLVTVNVTMEVSYDEINIDIFVVSTMFQQPVAFVTDMAPIVHG